MGAASSNLAAVLPEDTRFANESLSRILSDDSALYKLASTIRDTNSQETGKKKEPEEITQAAIHATQDSEVVALLQQIFTKFEAGTRSKLSAPEPERAEPNLLVIDKLRKEAIARANEFEHKNSSHVKADKRQAVLRRIHQAMVNEDAREAEKKEKMGQIEVVADTRTISSSTQKCAQAGVRIMLHMAKSLGFVNQEAAMEVYAIIHDSLSDIPPGDLCEGSELYALAAEMSSALMAQCGDAKTKPEERACMAPAVLALGLSQGELAGLITTARSMLSLEVSTSLYIGEPDPSRTLETLC